MNNRANKPRALKWRRLALAQLATHYPAPSDADIELS